MSSMGLVWSSAAHKYWHTTLSQIQFIDCAQSLYGKSDER